MTSIIHTIIKIKIKKLNFIIKTLDNYHSNISSNSSDDTDIDENDFASSLFDTKIKTQINIIEIDDDLSNYLIFQTFSSFISKKFNSINLTNPEFFFYRNYNIHIRFSIINNKKYLIVIIDNKNNFELRYKSTNIIQNFEKYNNFLFNPILFHIDFDIFTKHRFIKNLLKFGKTTNNIHYKNNHFNYNENYYSYNDGVFNYFIQINKSTNTLNYYYYRNDKYIFNSLN
jgi:hypothetical protein